jgi:hypothetical protein
MLVEDHVLLHVMPTDDKRQIFGYGPKNVKKAG